MGKVKEIFLELMEKDHQEEYYLEQLHQASCEEQYYWQTIYENELKQKQNDNN